jgi:hypothetical protein
MRDENGRFIKGAKKPPEMSAKAAETRKKGNYSAWNKGRPWDDEMKRRISETNKAKGIEPKVKFVGKKENNPMWKGGKPKCACGKSLSEYVGKRCAECYHAYYVGDKVYNWKGGLATEAMQLRTSYKTKKWRRDVFFRDYFTCAKTGVRGGVLNVHHIVNFASSEALRFEIYNGITLAVNEHKLFHSTYGNKNNTLEQIEAFIGRLLPLEQRAHLVAYDVVAAINDGVA